jgi:hypothetical protein
MPNLLALAIAVVQIGASAYREIDPDLAWLVEFHAERTRWQWAYDSHKSSVEKSIRDAGAVAGSMPFANETAADLVPWEEVNNRLRAFHQRLANPVRKTEYRYVDIERRIEWLRADTFRRRVEAVTPLGTVAGALAVAELSTRR